jgi:hypothetical protein
MKTERYAHGVLDIETLGNTAQAPIIQIGISLPTDEGKLGYHVFNGKISYEDSNYNFVSDSSTIEWWDKQDKTVKELVFESRLDGIPKESLIDTLENMNSFLENYKKTYNVDTIYLWSHATFDPPILINTLRVAGQKLLDKFRKLIHFRQFEDFRTTDWLIGPANKGFIHDIVESKTKDLELVHHYASDDAYYEHVVLDEQFKLLRLSLDTEYIDTSHLYLFGEIELPEEN